MLQPLPSWLPKGLEGKGLAARSYGIVAEAKASGFRAMQFSLVVAANLTTLSVHRSKSTIGSLMSSRGKVFTGFGIKPDG
jgi:hypothetical protein